MLFETVLILVGRQREQQCFCNGFGKAAAVSTFHGESVSQTSLETIDKAVSRENANSLITQFGLFFFLSAGPQAATCFSGRFLRLKYNEGPSATVKILRCVA